MNAFEIQHHVPWNKGKLTGQKVRSGSATFGLSVSDCNSVIAFAILLYLIWLSTRSCVSATL